MLRIIDCDPQTVRDLTTDYSKRDRGVGGVLQLDV